MRLRETINRPVDTRPCAVAGRFYPEEAGKLRGDIESYLGADGGDSHGPADGGDRPIRAIIVPHAGYLYSGPIAASVYRLILSLRGGIRRVVLIGPSHYVPFTGLACSSASAFATPFGAIPVDTEATQRLVEAASVHPHDEAHAPEHGLEVQLPFLIHALGCRKKQSARGVGPGFSIVPLLFGDVGYEPTADVLMPFFDDPQTLVVVSSDLSHYHDYDSARSIDRQTADAIVARRGDAITPDRACGHTAIRAALCCAGAKGLDVCEVDLRNSGDTAGPRDRVVGYGAFIMQ